MFKIILLFTLLSFCLLSCNSKQSVTYPDVYIVGAMKNVMWKGELGASINLDTISNKVGLYGLGPESFLTGELLINDGKSYVSRVTSDSTMTVEKRNDVSAPFFVYANVSVWNEIELPVDIKSIQDIQEFIDQNTKDFKRPFTFKLKGMATNAIIHSQNLPTGTKVASPEDAHQGQTNFTLQNAEVEIIGFFSTEHKGIFTHHDSYLHMHLITADETKMGHLDEIEIGDMKLYLPEN